MNKPLTIPLPTPATPLAEFIERWYMTAAHGVRKTAPGLHTRYKMETFVGMVTIHLQRTPLLVDLNAGTLEALKEIWTQQNRGKVFREVHESMFVSVWRFAADLKILRDAPPRANCLRTRLSEEDGTLWHICKTKYIPTNVRIQSENTTAHYRMAIKDLRDFLEHEPTLADLTDDNLAGMTRMLVGKKLAASSVNGAVGRLRALWSWLAKRRLVEQFPVTQNIKEPKRVPRGWTQEEVARIFEVCTHLDGTINGIPAKQWWLGLHYVLWDTGARIGEILALRWEWLNLETGYVDIPAEVRKGQERDMTYQFHQDTLRVLVSMRRPEDELVFPLGKCAATLYKRYRRILLKAGLPSDRRCMFHKMRRTVASHLQAAGHNASTALGHSSPQVTKDSYLDPHIVGMVSPSAVLFRPNGPVVEPVRHMPVAARSAEPVFVAEEWL